MDNLGNSRSLLPMSSPKWVILHAVVEAWPVQLKIVNVLHFQKEGKARPSVDDRRVAPILDQSIEVLEDQILQLSGLRSESDLVDVLGAKVRHVEYVHHF